ncbi:MAG: DNA polymerase III subunit [Thermomicrobiales bacterium]|nr:DNA polymerase III subunit [Thermomicrobiales bacterium]
MPRVSSRARPAPPATAPESGWPAWGDPIAAERLREIIRSGQVGQCYLLSGPSGVGKSALAAAFAQALVCEHPDAEDVSVPCGACRSCRNVMRSAHPDVERFDLPAQATLLEAKAGKGSTLTIEMVRRLRSSAALLPLEASRRLLIVDDAETLLEPAQQALLKTLEEPPATVTILLLCDEADALLPTVRSRCQEITVRPQPLSAIVRTLEERGVATPEAEEIALLSRGSAAWAMAAASDSAALHARREARSAARTWLEGSAYERLATAYRLGDQFSKRRDDVIATVQMVVQLLREELLRVAAASALRQDDDQIASQGALAVLARALSATLQCLSDFDANVRPRLAMEAMVLAWPSSGRETG